MALWFNFKVFSGQFNCIGFINNSDYYLNVIDNIFQT